MPVSTITGLNSGLQWADTVKSLMVLEQRPMVALETRRSGFESQLSQWSAVEAKLSALKASTDAIESSDELLTKSISSSDKDILTASSDSTAIPGSHKVIVNQLASNQVLVHKLGWVDIDTTAVNSSGVAESFSYSYAGENFTVAVPNGTTLNGLVNQINTDTENPGVTASILNDGSGGATAYHLVMSGNDTGADNTITILDTLANPTDLGDGTTFDDTNWSVTQTAKNSQIRVDGFPDPAWGWATPWIQSATNDVKDIIPGVTLQLKNTTDTTPVQIEISLDKADVKQKVGDVVKAFNEVINIVNSLTSYDLQNKIAGPLANDSLAKSLRSMLDGIVASPIPGTDETDRYRSLGEVGLKISSGGTVKLDAKKLDEALNEDAVAVARLFVFDSVSSSSLVSVVGHSDKTKGGNYAFDVTYDVDGEVDPGGTNTINGKPALIYGKTMIAGKPGTVVDGLNLMLADPGNGPATLSGSVKVYTGLASMLSAKIASMSDEIDGSLKTNHDRINEQIKNLNNQIDGWDERLKRVEANYNKRFQAMETLIGQLKTQSNSLAGLG